MNTRRFFSCLYSISGDEKASVTDRISSLRKRTSLPRIWMRIGFLILKKLIAFQLNDFIIPISTWSTKCYLCEGNGHRRLLLWPASANLLASWTGIHGDLILWIKFTRLPAQVSTRSPMDSGRRQLKLSQPASYINGCEFEAALMSTAKRLSLSLSFSFSVQSRVGYITVWVIRALPRWT